MESITFFLNEQEKSSIHKIFERSDRPDFTITYEERLPRDDLFIVRIFFESSTTLWYLLKTVFMEEENDKRLKEILDNAKQKIEDNFQKFKIENNV